MKIKITQIFWQSESVAEMAKACVEEHGLQGQTNQSKYQFYNLQFM